MYIYIHIYIYVYVYIYTHMKTTQLLKRNIGNEKRKLTDCEKMKKSGYVCLFSISP